MVLTREMLTKPTVKAVVVEAFGDTVYLRKLTAGDVVGMDAENVGLMLARSLADPDGTRMFTDDESKEAMQMPMSVVTQLVQEIAAFNGFDTEAQEKNSGSTPADGSSSI